MNSIPEPTQGQLAAMYPPGQHPVIDTAEQALRDLGVAIRDQAEQLLPTWPRYGTLTVREVLAVYARFPENVCDTCGGPIEYVPVPEGAGPAWGPAYWRHTRTSGSHIARPAVTA